MGSPRVVTIHYTLTDDTGTQLDSSQGGEPLLYLEGAGNIIPGLERQLQDAKVGEKKEIKVLAKEAYGEKQESLVIEVPKSQFPSDLTLKEGDRFRSGNGHESQIFTVVSVRSDAVTLDGNHPLAGKDLSFSVEVVDLREATEEEQSHGHVHGEGGHHH